MQSEWKVLGLHLKDVSGTTWYKIGREHVIEALVKNINIANYIVKILNERNDETLNKIIELHYLAKEV
jgi:hypothetical protein